MFDDSPAADPDVGDGFAAHDGWDSKHDWQQNIPQELTPHVINPASGYLFSGNHRPIQSFYQIPLGIRTGSMGDTLRSLRLRQLIEGKSIGEALEISNRAIAEALGGLPPIKMHCSVLAAEALRATLADYYTRRGEHAKALALQDEEVEAPEESAEASEPLYWDDFGRMVRAWLSFRQRLK